MITFFTTAKPFCGHTAIIQRNALQSWKLLHPDVEVILFGDDDGAAEVSAELGLHHEPRVERHESGMKYVNFMFDHAQKIAKHDHLCYSNCDIVLLADFRESFEKAAAWQGRFLMVAQRWDTDVTQPIEFTDPRWAAALREQALTARRQQTSHFIDFFVFYRGLYDSVPPMINGRSYWDHWLVWKALSSGVPVLDASRFVVPVHQNHDYGYHPLGKQGTNEDELALKNIELAGGPDHLRHIGHSTHWITRSGKIRPVRELDRAFLFCGRTMCSMNDRPLLTIRQWILDGTLSLRKRLGLRRTTLSRMVRGRIP